MEHEQDLDLEFGEDSDPETVIARAIVAIEGEGHNDPPFLESYSAEEQKKCRRMARSIIDELEIEGFVIIRHPPNSEA